MERCLVFLKPDAIAKRVVGQSIDRLEQLPGVRFARVEFRMLSRELLRSHYAHVVDKPFYPDMEEFLLSTPVLLLVLEGPSGTVQRVRDLLGPTDSAKAAPGTIRGDFGSREIVSRNIAHASDSPETAEREIALFFDK